MLDSADDLTLSAAYKLVQWRKQCKDGKRVLAEGEQRHVSFSIDSTHDNLLTQAMQLATPQRLERIGGEHGTSYATMLGTQKTSTAAKNTALMRTALALLVERLRSEDDADAPAANDHDDG